MRRSSERLIENRRMLISSRVSALAAKNGTDRKPDQIFLATEVIHRVILRWVFQFSAAQDQRRFKSWEHEK